MKRSLFLALFLTVFSYASESEESEDETLISDVPEELEDEARKLEIEKYDRSRRNAIDLDNCPDDDKEDEKSH
jgi:hypothetical protein